MNKNKLDVFMKYMKNINKQYYFWVSDFNWVIKNHAVKFVKNKKNENMNLQLCKQTFNIFSEQRFVKKSLKNNVSTIISKFDAFMIDISFKLIDALKIIMINLNAFNFKIMSHTLNKCKTYVNIQITQKVFALNMFKLII